MGQMYPVSRVLQDDVTFTGGSVLPLNNPISRGASPLQRIDFLDVTIKGNLTTGGGATSLTFADKANRDALLDAIYSNIRFYSSSVGEVIRNLSFSKLAELISKVNGGDFLKTNLPKPGRTVAFSGAAAAGTNAFTINISVPFRLNIPTILSAYAPLAGQFADGGLQLTTGSGAFTDGGGAAWSVDSGTRITWRLRGPEVPTEQKPSPLLYEEYNNTGIFEAPSGMYLFMEQYTDSATDAYATTGGASAGMRVTIDGNAYTDLLDFAPLDRVSDMVAESADPSGYDLDVAFSTTTAVPDYIWDRAGVPIFYVSYNETTWSFVVAERRVVVEPGANYTAAANYLAVRVQPTSAIGSAVMCGATIGAGVNASSPGGIPTSPAVRAQNKLVDS